MLYGVDISNWQAGINVSKLDANFVICKATEGSFFVDEYCDGFIQQAISSNKLFGFYHFAREDIPESEAKFFYDHTLGYVKKGIPILDYETWEKNDVEWCERFLEHYHKLTSVWPMLYISASHCQEFKNSWIPKTCGLWLAGYPYTLPYDMECPYDCSPWEFVAIWQYASDARLSGYSYDLDGDVAYMDERAWKLYSGVESNSNLSNESEKKIISGRVTIELD